MKLIDLRPKRVGADLRGVCQLSSNVNQYPTVLEDGNTVAWYDYTATDTITKDGSNFVSRWNDRLGSGHDLIQETGTNQPLLTSTGVLFDGVDNYMQVLPFSLEQPEFVYIVLNQKTWTDIDYIFDGNAADSGAMIQRGFSPNFRFYAGAILDVQGITLGNYGIVRALYNGAQSKIIVNENSPVIGNLGTASMNGYRLGVGGNGSRFGNFEVSEIVIRNVVDTEQDEALIYNYLKKKNSL